MSPSWRNRVCIGISPGRISLLKLGRGLKAKLIAKHDEAITASGKQPSQILDSLTRIFSQAEWQNAEANIVLSNRLARYATIAFNSQLQNYPAREAFARHSLVQVYGAAAEQWELRIQHCKAGAPSLVTAVDRVLLEGLRHICDTHKLELNSVVPNLMPVYNRYRKTIRDDPAWLVISEPGYSLFALLSAGEFVAVNGVCHDSISELPMLLDRENLGSSLTEPCKSVYVHASAVGNLPAMPAMGYEFGILDNAFPEDFPSPEEGIYAMAMSGVL